MKDPTVRFWKIGDALSQLVNVTILPHHKDTTSNESISGRSYRCGWTLVEKLINGLFFFDPDHCRQAHMRDVERAKKLIEQEKRRGRK